MHTEMNHYNGQSSELSDARITSEPNISAVDCAFTSMSNLQKTITNNIPHNKNNS